MKSLIWMGVLAGAGVAGAVDFPADTLLPVGWLETYVEPGFDYDSASFTYARDARDWLHETRVITEKSGYLSTTVTITDREGRYRGGSYQKRNDPTITFTSQLDSEGRLYRVAYDTPQGMFHEDYGYDARGGLVSRIRTDASGIVARHVVWVNTYDTAGRIVMSVESELTDEFRPWEYKRFYDTTGRLLYRHRRSGSINSVEVWDSTAYLYRADGRLHEEREHQYGGILQSVVRWEYRVWQVPLSLRPRAARSGAGYLQGYHGRIAFDPLGRETAAPRAFAPGGVPLFLRP